MAFKAASGAVSPAPCDPANLCPAKAQVFDERLEIPVGEKQRQLHLDTERSDDHIGRFTYGDASLAQGSKVFCALDRHLPAQKLENGQLGKQSCCDPVVVIIAKALENLYEDQIPRGNRRRTQQVVEAVCLPVYGAREIVYPNTGVDHYHNAVLISSRSPSQCSRPR